MKLTLEISDTPTRLDQALLHELRKEFSFLSRNQVKTWFKERLVRYQRREAPASLVLLPGSHEIEIQRLEPQAIQPPRAAAAPQCFLPVVYEDEDLLVLHKRSGIPSVPHSNDETETAVSAALAYHPELATVGRGRLEPGLLHRLDTGTSGLLVFAKSDEEFLRLRDLWKAGPTKAVRKTYRALVRLSKSGGASAKASSPAKTSLNEASGPATRPSPEPRTITLPLVHDPKSSRKMLVIRDPKKLRGQYYEAITHIRQVREIQPGYYDLEIEIETGVTHQIRCHLASQGWPILGDTVYKGIPSSRLWLHAWRLEIPLKSGALLKLESSLAANWPIS